MLQISTLKLIIIITKKLRSSNICITNPQRTDLNESEMWKSQSSVAPLQDKDFFQIPKFALTLFGWWTKDGEGLPFYFYINYLSLLLSSVVISSYGVIHIDNIPLAFDAFCPSATEVVSSIKMSSVLYFRKEYQSLLSSLFRFFKDGKSNAEQ